MNLDEHARHLGGLIGNLQSLEFLLRIALSKLPGARARGVPSGEDFYLSPVDSLLPENDLTSYDSLGDLISKFNKEMDKQGKLKIDESLVAIRDALAHGRVSASVSDETLRLLKFDKPQDGRVRVVFNEELSEEWFMRHKSRVRDAIDIAAQMN